MRYWLYLIAKFVAAAALFAGIWFGMEAILPEPEAIGSFKPRRFGEDFTWTVAIFGYFLAAVGTVYAIVLDQRYRCRTCLCRLRMPVNSGAWDSMLRIGTPQVEYICPFGHGTLNVKLVQFSGSESPGWRQHEDMWRELESLQGGTRK